MKENTDGLETALQIRKMDKYKSNPIVALTAFALDIDKQQIMQEGCSHFLSKPFRNEELLKLVESMLKHKE